MSFAVYKYQHSVLKKYTYNHEVVIIIANRLKRILGISNRCHNTKLTNKTLYKKVARMKFISSYLVVS